MESQTTTTEKTHEQLSASFQKRYEQIIGTPLTVEGINSYADNALNQMVELVEDALNQSGQYGPWQDKQQQEEQALANLGLPDVSHTLDHIYELSQDIHNLDNVIEQARRKPIDRVLVPPDPNGAIIAPGDGSFEKAEIIPRLKAILFVLEHDFGVDIHDPEQIKITHGLLAKRMVREMSYDMIEIPELRRIVLSCDEAGNRTFVFDLSALGSANITPQSLKGYSSKDELDELLAENPKVGQGVYYSIHFISRIKEAIEIPHRTAKTKDDTKSDYLRPTKELPDDMDTVNGWAKKLGVGKGALFKAVTRHSDKIGKIEKFRSDIKGRTVGGLSKEQIELVIPYLRLDMPPAPPDTKTYADWGKILGVSPATIKSHVDQHRDELGEVKEWRFYNGHILKGLSETQIEIIKPNLKLGIKPAPEGVTSVTALAQVLRDRGFIVSHQSLSKVIDEHRDELGELETWRFKYGQAGVGLWDNQIEIIASYLRSNIGAPPENIKSRREWARVLGIAHTNLSNGFSKHRDELGEIEWCQFGRTVAKAYSWEQVKIVLSHMPRLSKKLASSIEELDALYS
jgi:hypothetical protein